MRWLGGSWMVVAAAMAVLASGCSDDIFDTSDDDGTTGEPEPEVDYSTCARPMQDPSCSGSACGLTPQAADYLAIMLEEVTTAGHSSRFAPTRAEFFPLTNELQIDYQLQVSWFRTATTLELVVPDSDDQLRTQLAAHINGWYVPGVVADPEQISTAVEGCHPLLAYDYCLDNQVDFIVEDRYDWSEPGCVYKSTYVRVDAVNANQIECVVEQESPCD